jgi:hypothetical protein
MTIKIAQQARPKDQTYWDWSVWVEGSDAELNQVKDVVWKLHPTFVEPVQRATSRRDKFKLSTSGWGEFQIVAEVNKKDGKKQQLRHWLRFDDVPEQSKSSARTKKVPPARLKGRLSSPRPQVFVSYTRDNAQLANHLVKELGAHDIDAILDVNIAPGMDFQRWVTDTIMESDAVVVLVPNRANAWVDTEVRAATSAKVPIIPVVFDDGSMPPLPPSLKDYQKIQVKSGDPESIAPEIAQRIASAL